MCAAEGSVGQPDDVERGRRRAGADTTASVVAACAAWSRAVCGLAQELLAATALLHQSNSAAAPKRREVYGTFQEKSTAPSKCRRLLCLRFSVASLPLLLLLFRALLQGIVLEGMRIESAAVDDRP